MPLLSSQVPVIGIVHRLLNFRREVPFSWGGHVNDVRELCFDLSYRRDAGFPVCLFSLVTSGFGFKETRGFLFALELGQLSLQQADLLFAFSDSAGLLGCNAIDLYCCIVEIHPGH
jgi:hypothetical protein